MWSKSELASAFTALGISPGDLLFVHSSLRRLGPVEGGADGLIDALLACVGEGGTLAAPTLTWRLVSAEQPVFNVESTPSLVGAFTEVLRKRPRALRSLHPTHSVAALGARAEEFIAGHESAGSPCAPQTPYGRLRAWHGKILFIGVGLECCTFFHACEEWAHTPYLFRPEPEQYISITADGRKIPVQTQRHASAIPRRFAAMTEPLREIGALREGKIGDCPITLLDAAKSADWLLPRLREEPYLLVER